MQKKRLSFILTLTALTIFLLAGSAWATAVSDCELTVNWDQLSITGGSYETGWNYTGLHSETWINGPDPSNPGYVEDQASVDSSPLLFTLGNNTASLSSTDTHLISHTTSSSSGSDDTSGWINGNNHRGVSIGLLPGEDYTFSLTYHIDVSMSRDDAGLEDASNGAQVSLWLTEGYPHSDRLGQVNDPYSSNFGVGELVYSLSESGTITLNITDLAAGEEWMPGSSYNRYWFETHLHTSTSSSSTYVNPVPIPSTLLLLSSGLIGFAGIRRKLKKA